jgi:hypothetical protein
MMRQLEWRTHYLGIGTARLRDRGSYPDKTKRYLGAGAKLRKATISFVMSLSPLVCPSVRMKQLCSHRTNFHEI